MNHDPRGRRRPGPSRGPARRTHNDRAPNDRRAVSQSTGRIEIVGEPAIGALLAQAWRDGTREDRSLTHGLHAYPARIHPAVARRLIAEFSQPGEFVVDPFQGGGTVLVEALAAGRRAFGGDVNLVAARISAAKTTRLPGDERRAIESTASRIGGIVSRLAREQSLFDEERGPPELPPDLERWFTEDVFAELVAIRTAIDREPESARRRILELVLSSIAVRVSQKAAETVDAERSGRVPRGAAGRFFADRAREFGKGIAELCRLAPRETPAPVVALADARALPLRGACADLVVTSPPYVGTYDYAGIQAIRAGLLDLDLSSAREKELGSRYDARIAPDTALAEFERDLESAFSEMARVTKPESPVIAIVGDSAIRTRFIDGLALARRCAERSGLEFVAAASEERPSTWRFAKGRRREHAICWRR